jgi:hypothetical protein
MLFHFQMSRGHGIGGTQRRMCTVQSGRSMAKLAALDASANGGGASGTGQNRSNHSTVMA